MTNAEFWASQGEPPVAVCHRCRRLTWNPAVMGRIDQMRQPDGLPCGGTFEEIDSFT